MNYYHSYLLRIEKSGSTAYVKNYFYYCSSVLDNYETCEDN